MGRTAWDPAPLLDGVTLVNPIRFEVVSDIERLHVREAHLLQGIEGGLDVGASVPRTAAAIDDDLPVAWEFLDGGFEEGDALGFRARPGEGGTRDVLAAVEHVRSDLEDGGFRVEASGELRGLYQGDVGRDKDKRGGGEQSWGLHGNKVPRCRLQWEKRLWHAG